MKVAGNPIKLSGYEDTGRRGTAPAVDENRAAIVKEFMG